MLNGHLQDLPGAGGRYFANALNDAYSNDCQPNTIGVLDRVPVTVSVTQQVGQPAVVVVVQPTPVWVQQPASVSNPVRVQQPLQVRVEAPVSVPIAVTNNQALEEFQQSTQPATVTVTVPLLAGRAALETALAGNVGTELAKEIAIQAETNALLQQSANVGTQALRSQVQNLSPAIQQQIIQRAAATALPGSSGVGVTLEQVLANPAGQQALQKAIAQNSARNAVTACALG